LFLTRTRRLECTRRLMRFGRRAVLSPLGELGAWKRIERCASSTAHSAIFSPLGGSSRKTAMLFQLSRLDFGTLGGQSSSRAAAVAPSLPRPRSESGQNRRCRQRLSTAGLPSTAEEPLAVITPVRAGLRSPNPP
jgi:hypothetical protein